MHRETLVLQTMCADPLSISKDSIVKTSIIYI